MRRLTTLAALVLAPVVLFGIVGLLRGGHVVRGVGGLALLLVLLWSSYKSR